MLEIHHASIDLRGSWLNRTSLALPNPLRTGVYRLEIISAALRGLEPFTVLKCFDSLLVTIASKVRLNFGLVSSDAESAINT